MLRRLVDGAALACMSLLAIALCALFGFALKAAIQWPSPAPAAASLEVNRLPDDFLIIMDWNAGVMQYVSWKCLRTGQAAPATRLRRTDLAGLPGGREHPMDPRFRNLLLRDVDTGRLYPASGIWGWKAFDGVAGEVIGGRRVIDAVFGESTDQATEWLDENL